MILPGRIMHFFVKLRAISRSAVEKKARLNRGAIELKVRKIVVTTPSKDVIALPSTG